MSDIGRNSPCICGSIPNSKFLISHPSMPKIYNDSVDALAYALPSRNMNEFLISIAKGKTQKELEDSLIRLNRKSLLECYFARRGKNIYFNLYNETIEAKLHITSAGQIYFGSSSNELSAISTIYFLYRLMTDVNCPWNFASIRKTWPVTSSIAKSLFDFKNQKNPIVFDGIILKTNKCSETQIIEIGKSINNLNYLQNLSSLEPTTDGFSLNRTHNARKALLPINENQENVLHYIQYGTIRRSSWWQANQDQRLLACWDHIQFIFNDETTFSIKDLLSHPYAVFLPQDLIPEKLSSPNKLTNFRLWNEAISENIDQSSKIADISKAVLNNFINTSDYQSSKLKLYFSSDASLGLVPFEKNIINSPTPYIKIDHIQFLEGKNNYIWKIFGNKIIGCLKSEANNQISELINGDPKESCFHFSKDSNILMVNSFSKQKEIFKRLSKKYCHNITESQNEISAEIGIDVDISQLAMEFDQNISKQFNVHLNLDAITKIPEQNVIVNIFLDPINENLYQMAFNIEVLPIVGTSISSLSNIPPLLYRCLNGLTDGLGQFFYEYDNKDLAIQKQGEKRKNDLKLLRHSGIFKILLAEVIRYQSLPSNEQEKNKNFEKKLIQKASLALFHSSTVDMETKNEEQISIRVKGLIKEFIQEICMKTYLETYLFSDGFETYQVNLKRPALKLIESILEWIIYTYGELSLTKTQIKELVYSNKNYPKPGPLLSKRQQEPQVFPLFHSSELIKGVLASMRQNLYDVYISGQKIKSLSEEYFSSSIFIGENQGKINWFDLHPKIFFNGKEVTYEQLQEMKEKDVIFFEGTPYHINFNNMPKLKFLDRFWAKLKNTKAIKKDNQTNASSIFRQEKSLLLEVLSMRNAGINIETCAEWLKICNDFDALMENKIDDLDRHDFKVPLKDYQKNGTQWLLNLYKIGLGGVLADDMGLGKTIQVIGFLDILRLQGNANYHMIIVPTSLIYNWTSEIKRFAPDLDVEIFESKLKNEYDNRWRITAPKIVIITYGLLAENTDFLNQFNWSSAIFDEAQNLKNISSQRSTAARSLRSKSTFCVTGTPMENHYGEFYSLIDLCVPGALGEYREFMRTFSIDGFSATKLNDEIKFLKTKTSPLVLRRMKSDILEQLPEKAESSILIPFEKQQKEIYRNIAISWNDKIKSVIDEDAQSNTQLQMLTALLRLRQICSFPAMVDKIKYSKIPPKFELLYESIAEIYEKGESILIFTNFIVTLEEIEKYLRLTGYRTHSIHGSMTAKKRQSELQTFQENDQASILIMTLKTGGVGLNLTKASYVFHIEPWWNPAAENQATDRAHRMGQTKPVQVYRYLMKDSVEEKIQELKSVKGQAFDALFKEESEHGLANHKAFTGQLSYGDFQYLLN